MVRCLRVRPEAKPARRRPRPLRVGCVNTRGLPDYKWRCALDLVESGTFDLLFLLKTWHVDHAERRLHPRILAATEPPTITNIDTTTEPAILDPAPTLF